MPAAPLLASGIQYGALHASKPGLVICGVLVVLSVFSWTVMVTKLWLIRRARNANARFLASFMGSNHPLAIFQIGERHELSPLFHIYHTGSRELAFYLLGSDRVDGSFAARLQGASRITASQMGAVQAAMERAVSEAGIRLESRMSVVATALSGAPFLGLLGTVWGVMDSFAALAGKGAAATLLDMAPGVSAALLTTLAGLLVAIPSIFGYNLLVGKIRGHLAKLDHFASDFSGILDRHFVDHHGSEEALPSLGALRAPTMPAFSGTSMAAAPMSAAAASEL